MNSIYDGLFEEYNFLRSIMQDYKFNTPQDKEHITINGERYSVRKIMDRMTVLRKVLLEPYQ